MTAPVVAIVDYGAGNLHSVRRALERAGAEVAVTPDPETLRVADGVVLPGVGSARAAMERLDGLGLSDALREYASAGKPLLGVCLGMQLFFDESEEGPTHCLGLLPGRVVRMAGQRKVPHMGWNSLLSRRESPLLSGIADGAHAYFVHSYQTLPARQEDVIATSDYEGEVVAVVGRGSLVGTQFHPEKSGDVGLKMYENFVALLTPVIPSEVRNP